MKTQLILCSLFFAASCGHPSSPKPTDLVKANIEESFKREMNDPDSFEWGEISQIDTLSRREYWLRKSGDHMKKSKEHASGGPEWNYQMNQVQAYLDSMKVKDSTPHELLVRFSARGNNAMGAKTINKYKAYLGMDLTVKEIVRK